MIGRGAAAARADGVEECHGLFQMDEVTDNMRTKMKIIVARGNHVRLLALAELCR